jgi:hypothetical protein
MLPLANPELVEETEVWERIEFLAITCFGAGYTRTYPCRALFEVIPK